MSVRDLVGKLIELARVIQDAKLDAIVADLRRELIVEIESHQATVEKCNALAAENAELRKKVERMEDFDRYGLLMIGNAEPVLALRHKKANGEPPHWICAHCAQRGVKSLLTFERATMEKDASFGCPVCNHVLKAPFSTILDYANRYIEDESNS